MVVTTSVFHFVLFHQLTFKNSGYTLRRRQLRFNGRSQDLIKGHLAAMSLADVGTPEALYNKIEAIFRQFSLEPARVQLLSSAEDWIRLLSPTERLLMFYFIFIL